VQLKDKKQKRESGILLSITALPSKHGIGSLGEEAFRFVDFLKESNQSYWQLLPLCPVGKGNSPYSSVCSFAGEILLIDIKKLVDCKLLKQEEIPECEFCHKVDYTKVRLFKLPLLKKAAERFDSESPQFKEFKKKNEYWLESFALFMAISEFYPAPFYDWSTGLKYRFPTALELFKEKHRKEILFYEITQFLFFSQFEELKDYARQKGIKLIGDIPFYVSENSSDVWSNPNCFLLGRNMRPVLVAGVPPDIFSKDGQLWGNPIYDWEYMKTDGFLWWKNRLAHNARLYDVIRIDHFRAFADYYVIPSHSKNARSGEWQKGVGMEFFRSVREIINNTEIIAEDLGGETETVKKLVLESGFPNMKVLQFAFSSDLTNQFLPRNFNENCVCYTGTHDNDTSVGWYEKATQKEKLMFQNLLSDKPYKSVAHKLIKYGMESPARIVIIPLQDYLSLDSSCRTNTPGTDNGNWEWRFKSEMLNDELTQIIKGLSIGRN